MDSSVPLFLHVAFAFTTETKKLLAALPATTIVVPLQCCTLVGIAVVSTVYKSGEGVLKLTCMLLALWQVPVVQLLVMMVETWANVAVLLPPPAPPELPPPLPTEPPLLPPLPAEAPPAPVPPIGAEPPLGAEPPIGAEPPTGAEPPSGAEPPAGAEPPSGAEPPTGAEPPELGEPP